MSSANGHLAQLLRLNASWALARLEAGAQEPDAIIEAMLGRWSPAEILAAVGDLLDEGPRARFSFLLSAFRGQHLALALAERLGPEAERLVSSTLALSDSLYVPYDLRAAAMSTLGKLAIAGDRVVDQLRHCSEGAFTARQYKDLSRSPSNDIDHNFEIPNNQAERTAILLDAARQAMLRTRARLARRALSLPQLDSTGSEPFAPRAVYLPKNVQRLMATVVTGPGTNWRDLVIDWNEILVETPLEQYTVAEVLRLLLLDPEYHLPGHEQRAVADAVNGNALRLFCGATIGLKAGVLFVEHGFKAESSLFVMAENSILGKGCIVDATGVVVIEADAFLGGGFSPMLIHTHKHLRGGGAAERKAVAPTGFWARRGARLPMDFVGLLEVADLESPRWPGLERLEVEALPRASLESFEPESTIGPPPS